jgi:NAD(P)-dependent dehydrogenase (short-subunit alcohol dehydrogenase family)
MPGQMAGNSLSGRAAAVTGGARGIGHAIASRLVGRGMKVAIGDVDEPAAQAAAAELGCAAYPLDVTDPESFATFLDLVESELGPLDVMVNNAGILHLGPFVEEDEARQVRQVDINLHGPMRGTKLALRRMRPRGRGHIVNVASSAGKLTPPGIATYTATKHGVVGFTEAARLENADAGIEFSIVMPGVVRTEMIAGYESGRGVAEIEPEDVADAIVEAIQTGRVDVWVPRGMQALFRGMNLVPRGVADFVTKILKGDQVLVNPDHLARGAYEQRTADPGAALPPGPGPLLKGSSERARETV